MEDIPLHDRLSQKNQDQSLDTCSAAPTLRRGAVEIAPDPGLATPHRRRRLPASAWHNLIAAERSGWVEQLAWKRRPRAGPKAYLACVADQPLALASSPTPPGHDAATWSAHYAPRQPSARPTRRLLSRPDRAPGGS